MFYSWMIFISRLSLTEKSILDEINASEQLPPEMDEKRTSVCFYNIGITAGTLGGTKVGNASNNLKHHPDMQQEEDEEEPEGDDFI